MHKKTVRLLMYFRCSKTSLIFLEIPLFASSSFVLHQKISIALILVKHGAVVIGGKKHVTWVEHIMLHIIISEV